MLGLTTQADGSRASVPDFGRPRQGLSAPSQGRVRLPVDEKSENMQRFLKSAKVSFTVVRDAQQKLVKAADITGMPTSFLIDRAGKIRFIHAGFDRDQTPRQYAKEIEQLLKEPKP